MKQYRFVPRRDFVQFEPERLGEVTTRGGIALPETATERSSGVVVAVGPNVKDELIVPGARIAYSEIDTFAFPLSLETGKMAYYLPEHGIHAILSEKETDIGE